jgi:hypothetical protein
MGQAQRGGRSTSHLCFRVSVFATRDWFFVLSICGVAMMRCCRIRAAAARCCCRVAAVASHGKCYVSILLSFCCRYVSWHVLRLDSAVALPPLRRMPSATSRFCCHSAAVTCHGKCYVSILRELRLEEVQLPSATPCQTDRPASVGASPPPLEPPVRPAQALASPEALRRAGSSGLSVAGGSGGAETERDKLCALQHVFTTLMEEVIGHMAGCVLIGQRRRGVIGCGGLHGPFPCGFKV